jgi:hypothetical protein
MWPPQKFSKFNLKDRNSPNLALNTQFIRTLPTRLEQVLSYRTAPPSLQSVAFAFLFFTTFWPFNPLGDRR